MREITKFDTINNTDLNIYFCGMEDCQPMHSFGPAIRDHFILHYIIDGAGTFQINDKTYSLAQNQVFLIWPEVLLQYKADADHPWKYSWVGFHGLKAEHYMKEIGLTVDHPVLTLNSGGGFVKDCLKQMINLNSNTRNSEPKRLSILYTLLSYLIEISESSNDKPMKKNIAEQHVKKAVEFIQMNYSYNISISEIASYIGLDISYLGSIFKKYLNTSPQKLLISLRVNKACELLKNSNLSISDISRSVGYEDPFHFSRLFKRYQGVSPLEFRNR